MNRFIQNLPITIITRLFHNILLVLTMLLKQVIPVSNPGFCRVRYGKYIGISYIADTYILWETEVYDTGKTPRREDAGRRMYARKNQLTKSTENPQTTISGTIEYRNVRVRNIFGLLPESLPCNRADNNPGYGYVSV